MSIDLEYNFHRPRVFLDIARSGRSLVKITVQTRQTPDDVKPRHYCRLTIITISPETRQVKLLTPKTNLRNGY